eukprot:5243409-Pyramimonas_sp.AAC.1
MSAAALDRVRSVRCSGTRGGYVPLQHDRPQGLRSQRASDGIQLLLGGMVRWCAPCPRFAT